MFRNDLAPDSPSRLTWLAVLALAALGLVLRVWNNGFGLPDAFGSDEPKLVNHALAFGLGDPNPHYFVYPALQMYLLFACYGLLFVVLRLAGPVASLADFKLLFLTDPTVFYRVGRGLTALFGAASILVVWYLGRRLFRSEATGLMAAAALAVHPIAVDQAHYVTADVPVTFFLLVGLAFLARFLDEPAGKWCFLAGVAGGLATATKYSGLILGAPVLAACALAARRTGPRRTLLALALAGLGGAAAFTLASPYSLVEWRGTLAGMRFIYDIKKHGQFGIDHGPSWGTYLHQSFLADPLALLCLGGVLWSLARRERGDALLLSLAVPYFLTIGGSLSHSARYLVPLVPVLVLLAARLARDLTARLAGRRLPTVAAAAVLAVAVAWSAAATRAALRELGLEDTRTTARRWVEERVPSGTAVAIEWGGETVRLHEAPGALASRAESYGSGAGRAEFHSGTQMREALTLLASARSDQPTYRVVRMGTRDYNRITDSGFDLAALRAAQVAYVVTSSFTYGRPAVDAFRRAYPDLARFYETLEAEATLAARFDPAPGLRRGPIITIYRLSPAPVAGEATSRREE